MFDPVKHRTYFMPDFFYGFSEFPAAKKEPYDMLTTREWKRLMHHLFAHTVDREVWYFEDPNKLYSSDPRVRAPKSRKALIDNLRHTSDVYSEDEALTWALRMYIEQNRGFSLVTGQSRPPERTDIPREEHNLYIRACQLYQELSDKHPEVRGFLR